MRSPFKKNKTIASHPPQQKAIAHISKTNSITLLINHKAIANFSKTDRSREKESATGSHR
jgi:hypothetical protein